MTQVIDRLLLFDQQARDNVDHTLFVNLENLVGLYRGLSPDMIALNLNFTLPVIYPDYLWQITVFNTRNVTLNQDFFISCWDCLIMFQYFGYNIVVAHVDPNTTASLTASQYSNLTQAV